MTFEVDVTAGREPQCGHHGRGPEPDTEQGILVNILTNILVNILTNILVNILTNILVNILKNILINICDHGNVRQTQSKVILQTVLDSDEAIFEHAPDNDNFDNILNNITLVISSGRPASLTLPRTSTACTADQPVRPAATGTC